MVVRRLGLREIAVHPCDDGPGAKVDEDGLENLEQSRCPPRSLRSAEIGKNPRKRQVMTWKNRRTPEEAPRRGARRLIGLLAMVVALTSCTQPVKPSAFGGSKSDGTIVLGANKGYFDVIDWSDASKIALRKCAGWGYSGAEAFGGMQTVCIKYSNLGCSSWEVSSVWQCLD